MNNVFVISFIFGVVVVNVLMVERVSSCVCFFVILIIVAGSVVIFVIMFLL